MIRLLAVLALALALPLAACGKKGPLDAPVDTKKEDGKAAP